MGVHYTFTEGERPPTGSWPAPAREKEAGPRWGRVASGGEARGGADGVDGGDRT